MSSRKRAELIGTGKGYQLLISSLSDKNQKVGQSIWASSVSEGISMSTIFSGGISEKFASARAISRINELTRWQRFD